MTSCIRKSNHQRQRIFNPLFLAGLCRNFDPQKFFRIDKSHIINVDHIQKMDGASVTIDGKILPVAKQFRDELLKRLQVG